MNVKGMKTLAATLLMLFVAIPAAAQQIDIRSTPPAKERPDFVTPGPQLDVTHPRENEWYIEGMKVPFDPAFIEGASQEYETQTTRGRYGLAGWTAQQLPVGAPGTMYREQHGWPMFGFAITWGAAPRTPARPASAPARTPAPAR